ncbi:MAG: ATP:cob(I)alamin adenosyltransferase [Candidatus Magasanikbacteria bacterium CG11_big_fil_rev_8_21_14_0_20_43_7]|uniref:Corrinoid adenosyltransferase n=1 Tax=Candidatus Magasanikbacteria bacterium CG11_big_fil_rev_8_21_14_0_20_43_7 TaxID=1974654 RepID=A0A2H0N4N0_9BACT|nr:MAG: ATP:cob(I)alamin adenosyltransferase [Candidatus Magasanikbacteria bacterium CG11_big_fil_rev_8_21_14_0_20_43_7]
MKIYTKTGDSGVTSLLGGKRVRKSCIEIDAIGEVDELNSYLGVLVSLLPEDAYVQERAYLKRIQHHLFNVGGIIAAAQTDLVSVPQITNAHLEEMETHIDRLTVDLPPLSQFILPGGHRAAAVCHHARAVCRRAERRVVELRAGIDMDQESQFFLNRLSDFLFTLGRYINMKEGSGEVVWEKEK